MRNGAGVIDGDRRNAFDLLRLVGVGLVLVHHSWVLTSWALTEATPNPLGKASGTDPGTVGVGIFFAVSGYLVTASWLADPSPWRFVARRVLRLLPLLAVVIVVTALVVGPLTSTLPASTYLTDPATWYYLRNIGLFPELFWSLPGVLSGYPLNGSIWTLPVEVTCYTVVAVLGVATALRRRWACFALTALAVCFLAWASMTGRTASAFGVWIDPMTHFAIGAAARHLAPAWTPGPVVVAVTAVGWWAAWGTELAKPAAVVAVSTAVFVVAFRAPAALTRPTGSWDLSYGMYLTAFPIQMFAIFGAGLRSPWVVLAIAIVGSAGCAALTWPLIERPALRFKPKRPGAQPLVAPRTAPRPVEAVS